MWLTVIQAIAAAYLILGSLVIDADSNWQSRFIFKIVPMCLGFPLAIGVAGKLLGWPL